MRTKRATALVGVLAMAGTAVAVTAGAHAQSGSRLCGVFYRASTTHEIVVKLYEYPPADQTICRGPTQSGENPAWDQPFVQEKQDSAWTHYSFKNEVCEDFPNAFMNGMDFRRRGGGWPSWEDHNDICHNMNRSDTVFELERYYAHYNGDPYNNVWDFMRD